MNRFEQLIEYVINDEEQKARELFHDIVVAKSREIYENIMAEEAEEDLDEGKEEELDEAAEEELDEAEELDEEEVDEGAMGGDASDQLIDDVEMEEESDMNMEDEEFDMASGDMEGEGGDEPASKADIQNLESTIDELLAKFDEIMGGDEGNGDMMGPDEGGDALEVDDTEEMDMDENMMAEALELKAAPKPVTSEEGSVNKKSTVTANSGQAGMAAHPVKMTGGDSAEGKHDTPAYKNTTKDLGVAGPQDAGKKAFKSAAPAPVKTQAAGVNTRSPLPRG